MELRDYLNVLSKWLWLIILATTIAATIGYFALQRSALLPAYRATAVVMVGDNASRPDPAQLQAGQELVRTCAELAKRQPVAQAVVESLGLPISADKLRDAIEINPIPDTQLIEIVVTYNDPQQAAAIANEVASQLATQADVNFRRNLIHLVAEAQPPTHPSLSAYGGVLVAAFTGLILATCAAFLIEYFDDTIKTAEDVRRHLLLPILGTIKRLGKAGSQPIWWALVEACQRLCGGGSRPAKLILVTSPGPSEGKSTTATNLALAWAKTGQRTVLVDAHLRHPALHRRLGLPNDGGLSTLLQGSGPVNPQALASAGSPNLRVLTGGPAPSDPSELLASQRMGQVLDELAEGADVVILDGPPVLSAADAAILASKVDGILLVLHRGGTKLAAASEAVEALRMVGGKILGVVLNEGKG